jgi:putative copper export protein
MISFVKRLVIIVAVVVSIEAIAEFALIQQYGTILVVVPIIIVTILAIAINIAYWSRKSHIS